MKKVFTEISIILVIFSFSVAAYAMNDEAKAHYKLAKENAAATYKIARAKCDELSSNAKNICIAEAKAAEKRTVADAEARYENTPKAKMKARIAIADADYSVAKEKCKAYTGNEKSVCIKEAKAAYTKAKVDAKSTKELEDIRSDADEEKRDADYKVMLEKCDSLSGPAKDACVASTKSRYGK